MEVKYLKLLKITILKHQHQVPLSDVSSWWQDIFRTFLIKSVESTEQEDYEKREICFWKNVDWWPAYYPFHLLKMWRKKKRSGSIFHFNFSISAVVSIKIGSAWGGERDHCHRVSHLICLDTGEEGGGRWEILDWEMWEPIDNLMSALTTWQDPWDISVHHCIAGSDVSSDHLA